MDLEQERYAKLAELFERYRNMSPDERVAMLAALDETEAELATQLRALLAADEEARTSLSGGLEALLDQEAQRAPSASAGEDELPWMPETIGEYRVVRRLGEGGMGVVFEAEQRRPARRVAVKVIHPMSRSATTLKRFELESEILARLHHPGIAQIYETGTFDAGRGQQPFIVMELVAGIDARTFAERAHLDVPTRLALFAEIAEAVQHAHEKGVVHRDLKPGNVLVDEGGRAKVLDFGIARVSDESTLMRTTVTESGQLLGTLNYMAPEQLEGSNAITGRVDVYALGAIAYELLTGRRPHEIAGLSLTAAIRMILEQDVPRASSLAPELNGDIETIVGKALEKEPERRYASPGEFAADLRRFLEHRPISARAPSAAYRSLRFARRNRGLVTGVGVAIVAIASGFGGVLEFAQRESQARTKESIARANEAQARAASESRLAELRQMSDVVLVQDLIEGSEQLWPQVPEMIDEYRDWLSRADELLDRRELHRASVERIRAVVVDMQVAAGLLDPESAPEPIWDRVDQESRWQFQTLSTLVAGLAELAAVRKGVESRLAFAVTVEARSIAGPDVAALWEEAIDSIRWHEGYRGLKLEPQLGLVPLGRDPSSGLWEFGDLQTGELARRAADGTLVLTEETGLVFVLLPGGKFTMGAQAVDPALPNYDPHAADDEGPVHEVQLSPFFLSKYEMTQGQWLHMTGTNPSLYGPAQPWEQTWIEGGGVPSLLHPAERVSWFDCLDFAEKLALDLPTEAQWEYALRAGTTSIWFFGSEESSIAGYANLSDGYAYAHGAAAWVAWDLWLQDGYTVHAPVNSHAPNGFGFHGILGNVWEWCKDGYYPNYYERTDAVDPVAPTEGALARVNRGGSHHSTTVKARSANRNDASPKFTGASIGFRPARPVR